MKTHTLAVLQARMSSSRLSGKVLMDINGEPMIHRQISRIKESKTIHELVVATSIDPSDDLLVEFLEKHKIQTRPYFAGNIMLQPGYSHLIDSKEVIEKYPVSRKVTTDTFFLGCSPIITLEQIEYIKTIVDKFFNQ